MEDQYEEILEEFSEGYRDFMLSFNEKYRGNTAAMSALVIASLYESIRTMLICKGAMGSDFETVYQDILTCASEEINDNFELFSLVKKLMEQ